MSSILITGGTGTLGRALIRRIRRDGMWERVICLSRDEVKQAQVRAEFQDFPRLFLGDVRDRQRLAVAFRGVETVVHAAALKRVDAGAYSPSEMKATNVDGTMNVVDMAIQEGVRRVVVVSSDKGVAPTNIYGKSKSLAEDLAINANSYGYAAGTHICAVRYGNVLGSRGSVIGLWRDQLARGEPLTVTDPRMTRFVMTIEQAVDLVLHAIGAMIGGEVFVPLLPSAQILALARAVANNDHVRYECVGMRAGGEKLSEALLNEEEPSRTRLLRGHYVVTPSHHEWVGGQPWPGEALARDFVYRSDGPTQRFLTADELRALLAGTEVIA